VETVGDDWSKAESDDGTGGCWGRYFEVLARPRRHPSTGTAAVGGERRAVGRRTMYRLPTGQCSLVLKREAAQVLA
jgi:hypothetical protein